MRLLILVALLTISVYAKGKHAKHNHQDKAPFMMVQTHAKDNQGDIIDDLSLIQDDYKPEEPELIVCADPKAHYENAAEFIQQFEGEEPELIVCADPAVHYAN